jgi:phage/plasmid-like protein (TIGR03299 family)
MAHNLNFNKSKYSFFSVRERAWHGLGTVVDNALTSEEAIKTAGLDYHVEKRPVHIYGPDGGDIVVPDSFATVRTDTNVPFGVVGSRYEVLQNTEAFEFFDAIVGKGEAIFETAGALGKGETIFITAKLPNHIQVGNGDNDLIEQYLFLTNNHCGKGVVQAAFTPIRIVCNNTLNAALRHNSNRVRIMHNSDVKSNLKEAHKVMGIVNKLSLELGEIYNRMAKTPVVDAQLKELIVATFATKSQLEKLGNNEEVGARFETLISDVYAYALGSDTQQMDTTRGTAFGFYNAITGYLQNVKPVYSRESQLNSIMDGTAYAYGQKAFDLAKSLL